MSEIPLEGPEISLDQVQALSALEKAFEEALSQVPLPYVLSRIIVGRCGQGVGIDNHYFVRVFNRSESSVLVDKILIGEVQAAMVVGPIWLTQEASEAGHPFDFAQGKLFTPPEKRLRPG